MMAATKNGNLKKKRTDLTRLRRGDPNPEPDSRRSLRPRQRRYLDDYEDEDEDEDFEGEEEEDEEDEERGAKGRRKLKLVLKLPPISTVQSPVTAPKSRRSSPPDYSPSSSSRSATPSPSEDDDDDEEEEIVKPLKKRRIERAQDSDGSGHRQERFRNVAQRPIRAVSGTPMPQRRVLEPILDRLQKKDTYGVFAEPVNPEELPDYHDVIEHPMDFGTIRRKLANCRYRTFEQFEDDVFLICSNAMQYNAPDTVYFRQAHSIQDVARRSFQEIRASCIFRAAERKSEEKIISPSTEKLAVKKIQGGTAPKPSSGISFMEKTKKQSQCRNAPGSQDRDISSSEKMALKMPQRRSALEPLVSDITSMDKKMLKKPQYKAKPEPLVSHISSVEKKTLKKPQHRTIPEPPRSDISSMEKKMVMKPQYRVAPETPRANISSMVKKTLKKHQHRTASGPPGSDIAFLEETTLKKPQHKTSAEPFEFDISFKEKKTLKKPQHRILPEAHDSDISSMEKITVKKHESTAEPEPLVADTFSQEKVIQEEHQSRTAPDPLDSDNSSGATLASAADVSAADTFTGLSKAPANDDASATEPCTGLTAAEASTAIVGADTSTGLNTAQSGEVERFGTINGFIDESSSHDEIKPENSDEVPVKSSPSKLALKPFVVDVTRRDSYNTLDGDPLANTDSVFDVFESEPRELFEVGLHSEHSYARSLARFAASLGPIGWDIASKKIEQALPPGVKFGPGWVGEYEPLPTPVLSVMSSAQQQPKVTRSKYKGNEKRSEAISAVSRKDKVKTEAITVSRKEKRNEIISDVISTVTRSNNLNATAPEVAQSGQFKDIQFGAKSQAITSTSSNRERTLEQKRGLFSVNLEPAMQQQKNQPANRLEGHQRNICFEAANSASPTIMSTTRNQVQKPQQQKQQVSGDFTKAYSNEAILHRTELFSTVPKSNFLPVNYVAWNQVRGQTELQKQQLEAVASQRNAMSNWRSLDSTKPNTPFGIVSNHQPGAQYWLARGSQEQAVNDPLRWMSSSGKISTQPNTIIKCNNNAEQTKPTVQIQRENPNAASAAAQAWMSIGASAGWRPVDGRGVPNPSPSLSPSPNWTTTSPAFRAHEEPKVKAEPVQGVSRNSQAQPKGLVIFPQLMANDLSRSRSPWQGLVQQNKQKDTLPPDLNISFQPPGSPARSSSGMLIDSQQPDLALQL